MRQFRQMLFAFAFCAVLVVAVAWVCGFTPETLTDGMWQADGDHPTNWLDAGLHPDAPAR